MTRRQRFGYWLVQLLGMAQVLCYKHIIKDIVWRSANGKVTPLRKMNQQHLWNAYNMCVRQGVNDSTVRALAEEIDRRIQAREMN
jgi:hypothetical protein